MPGVLAVEVLVENEFVNIDTVLRDGTGDCTSHANIILHAGATF